jgi:hypothetical protein
LLLDLTLNYFRVRARINKIRRVWIER